MSTQNLEPVCQVILKIISKNTKFILFHSVKIASKLDGGQQAEN